MIGVQEEINVGENLPAIPAELGNMGTQRLRGASSAFRTNPRQYAGFGKKKAAGAPAALRIVVETMRIELTTSALRTRRSPS